MASPKVKVFGIKKKVNPIVRERDNTSDLELAELKAHQKYKGLKTPANIDPANNGTVTTTR